MAAHAAVPARHHGSLGWAMPVGLGLVYGTWVLFIRHAWGDVTWGDVLYAIVAGVILAALALVLGRTQNLLPRELRAGAYGVLCGVAMGFLYSLTDASVLSSAGIGAIFGAVMLAVSFYLFYMREP
ncbi:hypothetical protein [Streptomyces sp. SLBN-118]|uniref:hypothetical protein n=1 Tax=Streptomyces sp. SLBN-118 TaxID=2768454 RepID=UPI0011534A6C|nr:hypothetical protein [Streptomyces sp. SLBN-118]